MLPVREPGQKQAVQVADDVLEPLGLFGGVPGSRRLDLPGADRAITGRSPSPAR